MLLGVALCACSSACTPPRPVVSQVNPAPSRELLARLAILPFSADPELTATRGEQAAGEIAARIQAFVSSELASTRVALVAPGEPARTPAAEEGASDRSDLRSLTAAAAEQSGATAVLLGSVSRYIERSGGSRSTAQPASVAFELTLRAAPGGRRLWSGRFDETQHALTTRPLEASRLPGGGMRWLTAGELARWGAQETVRAMLGETRR